MATEAQGRADPPPVREDRPAPGRAAAGLGANFLFPARARRAAEDAEDPPVEPLRPGLRQVVRRHLHQGVGRRRTTPNVVVDHIAIGEINARAAAEVAAKKGHDLFMFLVAAGGLREAGHRPRRRSTRPSRRSTARRSTLAREVDLQPEDEEVLRLLGLLRAGPRQLPQGPLGEGRLPERPGHLGRPARRRQEDQGPVRQPRRRRPLAGARHEHGHAGAPLVLRRRRAGRGGQRHDQLQADDRGHQVHAGALQGGGDARRSSRGTPPRTTGASSPGKLSFVDNAISVTRSAEKDNPDMSAKIMLTPGAQGPGPPHRGRARHGLLRDLGLRREQGRRQAVPGRLHRQLRRGVQGERVLQLPLLPLDGAGPGPAALERSEGEPPGQVQGPRQRPRLGHQRRLSRLRDGRRSTRSSTRSSSRRCSPRPPRT